MVIEIIVIEIGIGIVFKIIAGDQENGQNKMTKTKLFLESKNRYDSKKFRQLEELKHKKSALTRRGRP